MGQKPKAIPQYETGHATFNIWIKYSNSKDHKIHKVLNTTLKYELSSG